MSSSSSKKKAKPQRSFRYKIYFTDNHIETHTLPAGKKTLTLEEAQQIVGGRIQLVRGLDKKMVLVVNEEGMLKQLPRNFEAGLLVSLKAQLYGNVIYCSNKLMN